MAKKLLNVIFIIILGSVCTLMLLGLKAYTYPIVAKYEELKLKSTILDAAGIDFEPETVEEIFSKNIRKDEKTDAIFYLTPNNFYIFEFSGRGVWGQISGVVTLNPDLETLESIRIVSQEETPGLGARITEDSFLAQFKKKKAYPELKLIMRRKSSKVDEVDSISGASLTSIALVKMINESVKDFRQTMKR